MEVGAWQGVRGVGWVVLVTKHACGACVGLLMFDNLSCVSCADPSAQLRLHQQELMLWLQTPKHHTSDTSMSPMGQPCFMLQPSYRASAGHGEQVRQRVEKAKDMQQDVVVQVGDASSMGSGPSFMMSGCGCCQSHLAGYAHNVP